jgi:hypothetical protein
LSERQAPRQNELNAGGGILLQADELLGGVSFNAEKRDDDRQPDHLLDHRQPAAGLDDHQVSSAETLGELKMNDAGRVPTTRYTSPVRSASTTTARDQWDIERDTSLGVRERPSFM